ncbi:MAG: flagellar motor protein MotB [Acidobacteria bacterium]|nr:MAG: flagellar motor protein MotB [Acidobacteriota bacterium]
MPSRLARFCEIGRTKSRHARARRAVRRFPEAQPQGSLKDLPHGGCRKMKNRAVVALFVAFLLTVSALAQQSTAPATTDQSAPAASSSNSTDSASGKAPLQYETRQGFWGKVNPFARKKYVQKQLTPIQNRVNELDELTAANSKMIRDVDSRAQQGIQMASNKANEADQHAVDAGNKATAAQDTATKANNRLTTVEGVVSNIDQYKATNQTEIRFRPGQSVLSQNAKTALDQMAEPLKGQHGYIVEVQGFSSGKGQAAIGTSRKMADAVVRYLVENHEIPVYRIYVLGMGNAPAPAASSEEKPKRMSGGRVEVSLLKNDLEQLATSNTAPAPAQ